MNIFQNHIKWRRKKTKKKRKTERIWHMNKFDIRINFKLNNFVFEEIQNPNEIRIWTNSKSEQKKKQKMKETKKKRKLENEENMKKA